MNTIGDESTVFEIVESTWSEPLSFSDQELSSLRRVRDEWVRISKHWSNLGSDEDSVRETYVVELRSEANNLWRVKVNDAIGAIDLGSALLVITPKIPLAHFTYIAERALVPADRLRQDNARLAEGASFLELITTWTLFAIERVVRDGLIRDYREKDKAIGFLAGKVDLVRSTRNFFRGNLNFQTRVDEFNCDSSINRILKQALKFILKNQTLSRQLHQRCRSALAHFGEVGEFRIRDLRTGLSRSTHRYAEALDFSRHLILGTGRALSSGSSRSHSFLYKTPALIEEGIRRIVQDGLSPTKVLRASKQMKTLPSTRSVSANPDLTFTEGVNFDGLLVGDIKYKIQAKDWKRNDLAQAVFFAAAFESPKALILDFADFSKNPDELGDVAIGKIAVSALSWDIAESSNPADSEQKIIRQVSDWLETDKLFLLNQGQKLSA